MLTNTRNRHIAPGTLTINTDRGNSITSKPVAALLADLKVGRTLPGAACINRPKGI